MGYEVHLVADVCNIPHVIIVWIMEMLFILVQICIMYCKMLIYLSEEPGLHFFQVRRQLVSFKFEYRLPVSEHRNLQQQTFISPEPGAKAKRQWTLRDLMLKPAGPWMDRYCHLSIHCILIVFYCGGRGDRTAAKYYLEGSGPSGHFQRHESNLWVGIQSAGE